MNTLSPLIELAAQKSLDLFFRTGQGFLARSMSDIGQRQGGSHGLSPLGVQSRAQTRIVCAVRHVPHASQPYARPGSAG